MPSNLTITMPTFPSLTPGIQPEGGLLLVGPDSLARSKNAVKTIARYFQREMHTDMMPYLDFKDRAAVLLDLREDRYEAAGACGFRWGECGDAPPGWAMAWVWVHPFLRRRRALSAAWPALEGEFGGFWVDSPYSDAMRAFLTRHDSGGIHWPGP